MRPWGRLLFLAILAGSVLLPPRGVRAGEPSLVVSGASLVPEGVARRAAGTPPRSAGDLADWAAAAALRVERVYKKRGYLYVRAWARVEDDGRVAIEVDEGRMHGVVFVGAGAVRALLFRVDLHLPQRVFHRATLQAALDDLQSRHRLQNIYYRVTENGETATPALGVVVPQRILHIYVVTRESFGWDLEVELGSTWGLLVGVGFRHRDLVFEDDRFRADLDVAVPYRRYLFDAEPSFQWVHGRLGVAYRSPAFAGGRIAAFLEGATAVSRYERSDLGLERFLTVRTPATLGLALLFPPVTIRVGGGLEHVAHFAVERSQDATETPATADSLRYTGVLRVAVELDPGALRLDLRDEVHLNLWFASTAEGDWMLAIRPRAQIVFHFGRHDLILAARGVYVTGDVRFWDEAALAGDQQRVFFGNRYWVRAAAQLGVGFRLAVWEDTIKLGVFHDVSAFSDRTRPGNPWVVANAFGPSFHALFWDFVALDVYYGFGFAEVGFSHNLSFSLATVF